MKTSRFFSRLPRRGYTLIEVLAAAAVIAVGMSAAVSLVSSLMTHEELAWRTAITRNYQENMARLWQLGMSPTGSTNATNIGAVMPTQKDSPLLNEAINGTPYIIETGTTNPANIATMMTAAVVASVNISADANSEKQGLSLTFSVYRPQLPTALRTGSLLP